ncbi:MAG TPA: DinB family protein [Symbiobacteriaceae bacterium]|nr:DinB family protein [Symbiobacteriaceae bacterium]
MATYDIEAVPEMDPAIAGFWYAYAFGRPRFNRLLEGLTPEQLAQTPAGFNNSIAAVVVHVAGVEVNFAHRILGQELPAHLKSEFLLDQPQSPLPQPTGETVESLVDKLHRAEGMIKVALSSLKAADLDRELKPGSQAYTLRWLLSLVTYHATNHFGQLQMIKQHLG